MKVNYHTIAIVASFVLLILGGTLIYHSVEEWSYLDSAYFLVITATTIGYGDITPQTDLGKILTMIYSFIGVAFVLYLVSTISHAVFEKKMEEQVEDIKQNRAKIKRLKKDFKKV
jgi:voltage-gated potassium channel